MDAITQVGWIEVTVLEAGQRTVDDRVRQRPRHDPDERRRAVTPATTKWRGWGPGLPYGRVVAEYHGRYISIVESVPGRDRGGRPPLHRRPPVLRMNATPCKVL
jgi:hypothetical protein